MQSQEASSSIADLPEEVLVAVVGAVTCRAHGNAGDVCRFMLVCALAKPSIFSVIALKYSWTSELQKATKVNACTGALLATSVREARLGV